MKSLVPGQFTTATVRAGGGELEAQLSQGGNWQIKVRLANEPEWRLLCVGHLDGRVLAPAAPAEPEANVKIGPLSVDFVRRRVEIKGAEQSLRAREFDLLAVLASEPGRLFTKDELLMQVWGIQRAPAEARALSTPTSAVCDASCAGLASTASSSTTAESVSNSARESRSSHEGDATTVRIDDELDAEVNAVARAEGVSASEIVRAALYRYVADCKSDPDFQARLRKLLEKEREVIERLAAGQLPDSAAQAAAT